MDEHQQPLKLRGPLLLIGVPHGVDEALRSIRYDRQTGEVPQRIGHEDQTPMCPDGIGTPHATVTKAQQPLAILITCVRRPPFEVQVNNLVGAPVASVCHLNHRTARQQLLLETHRDVNFVQTRNTDSQREVPVGMRANGDGGIVITGDQRHEVLYPDVRARQLQRPTVGIPQVNAGCFQLAVLFEQTDPVLSPPG